MPDPTASAASTADTTTTAETTTEPAKGATTSEDSQAAPQGKETDTTTETATVEAVVPDAYEFTLPDGMAVDAVLLEKATPTFKELKLTNEQAGKIATLYAEHVAELSAGGQEAFDAAYAERVAADTAERSEQWLEQTKADKEIGGGNFEAVKTRVSAAMGAVGTAEAKQMFNDLGWGNNPELIRTINRLIDYVPEDKGERPAGAGGTKQLANRLWPDM